MPVIVAAESTPKTATSFNAGCDTPKLATAKNVDVVTDFQDDDARAVFAIMKQKNEPLLFCLPLLALSSF